MNNYKAYLFDMDGTLVDSEPLKGQALALACRDYGVEVDHEIYKEVMGESWSVVTNHFFTHASINPTIAEFNQYFRAHYEELLAENVQLISGAKEFITRLRQSGKMCAVVSSAASWMVANILNKLELKDLFDIIITQEDVSRHKPDPEAYELSLVRLGVAPNEAVVFEDSNAGVKAAIASGCKVVAVRHEFNGNNDLSMVQTIICSYDEGQLHEKHI